MKENGEEHKFETDDQEIDLIQLARNAWNERRFWIVWTIIGAVIGIIIVISIPKEYTTTIKLVTESSATTAGSSGLGSIASMAGISTQNMGGKDAISPQLYPDIVRSVPFIMDLFDVKVRMSDNNTVMTVREYVSGYMKSPWWSSIMSLPGRLLSSNSSKVQQVEISPEETFLEDSLLVDSKRVFNLTPSESGLVGKIASLIDASLETKTSVVTISVTMQDPLVSAILADTVASRLTEYVTAYRTEKARADLRNTEKLYNEAKEQYYTAQKNYANYVDKNQGVVLRSVKTEEDRLLNEMQLAYNLYNTTAQQLQVSKAKVQEIKPVFTVLEPAKVPLSPSKPSKFFIIFGCAFIAFFIAVAWILFGRNLVQQFRSTESKSKSTDAGSD